MKMKKATLLLFLFISGFYVQAQEKKLTKQEALDYIKSYYSDFETASDQYKNSDYGIIVKSGYSRPVRRFTANYKVEFKDCKFTMTYDAYKWPYEEKSNTTVIEFNLYEIDSIQKGPSLMIDSVEDPSQMAEVNSTVSIKMKKGNKAKFLQKDDKEELVQYEDEVFLKMNPEHDGPSENNAKLILAFERLREFCITNK